MTAAPVGANRSPGAFSTDDANAELGLAAAKSKIGPGVSKTVGGKPDGTAVIITFNLPAGVSSAAGPEGLEQLRSAIDQVRERLQADLPAGVEIDSGYSYVPAVAATITTQTALSKLLELDSVAHVALNVQDELLLADSVPLIGADDRHAAGNDGDGVRVVVMDSGIDLDHPDLVDDVLADQACFGDDDGSIDGVGWCPNGSDRQTGPGSGNDGDGHGTHVAGIISSNGTAANVGVAPGAELIAIKVFPDDGGGAFRSEIVAGWDWLIANQSTLSAQVINMSFGGGDGYTGDCDADIPASFAAMATLRSLGIVPVTAAGNAGTSQMSHPACLSNTIAIGSSTDGDVPSSFTDSSTIMNVFAPGSSIVSSGVGGGTATLSGTSMASPHAAGCAALFLDDGEATTVDEVQARMESSATLIQRYGQIFPRVDCGVTSTAICPPDDSLEDNDTFGTATEMGSFQSFPAISCDDDYYAFDVFAGDDINVDVLFDHADGDLQLELLDSSGAVVASSTSSTDDESITYTAGSTDTYTTRVFGASGATNSYVYNLSAAGVFCPPDDGFEDNDTQATATGTAVGDSLDAFACSNDDDWYSFSVGAGETIEINVGFSHSLGDVDAAAYDAAGVLLDSGTSITDNEQLLFTSTSGGTYSVLVYGYFGATNRYSLNIDTGFDPCIDPYEENDTQATAAPITPGTTISAVACDDDWFSFSANAGDDITSDLTFLHADGDLDFELIAPDGTILDGSYSGSDNEFVSATASSTGTYAVLVFQYLGAENSYDLVVNVTGGGAMCDGRVVTVDLNLGQAPTNNDDVILGTPGPDIINALGGNDVVCGEGGNDIINGGDGNDKLLGGIGSDRLYGVDGADTLNGENGADRLYGGDGNDTLSGMNGNDLAYGGRGADRVFGGAGNDTLYGNNGADRVYGGEGNDNTYGGNGNDQLYGGSGDDTMAGNGGVDVCNGGSELIADSATTCETVVGVP